MKKIILIVIGLLIIGGGIYFFNQSQNKDRRLSPINQNDSISPTQAVSLTTKKYLDQEVGFSFEYPDSLEATVSPDLKDTVYADITIAGKIKGSIRFLIEDTVVKTPADYLDKNQLATIGAQILDTQLAELPAKKYLFSDRIWILMVDQNIAYWLSANLQEQSSYWTAALDTISSTFAFEKVTTAASTGFSDAGDIIDEGEELVE